jgi:hypothetical protein
MITKNKKITQIIKSFIQELRIPWRFKYRYKQIIDLFLLNGLNINTYKIFKKMLKTPDIDDRNKYLVDHQNELFNEILKTPCFECNPDAEVEIHSLTCHRDLNIYLLAIKSFLRFYNDVAVIVHDDGSLNNKDILMLKKHIKNIKIITKKEADEKVNLFLKNKPNCKYFRNICPIAKQLFDYTVLSKNKKIISLDSDIIFLKKPDEVIKWIKNKTNLIIYNYENTKSQILSKYKIKESGDINGGFVCYYKDMMNYDIIERVIKKIIKEKEMSNFKLSSFSQNLFSICIYYSKYESTLLDKEKYLVIIPFNRKNINNKNIMVHFPGYIRFYDFTYLKLGKKVIKKLKKCKDVGV